MTLDYSYLNNATIEDFRKCVEYCFPKLSILRDDLQRGNPVNKKACSEILKGNPSKYHPHNLELFAWKTLPSVEDVVEFASCYCGKLGVFNKNRLAYGSCCQEHSKDNRIKKSETSTLKKYGVRYNLQNKKTHEKTLEKWNGQSPFSNKEIQERAKKTIKEKYGVDNAMQVKEICQKSRRTRLEIYGTEKAHPEKAKATMQERYGVDYFSQSNKFKKLWPKNGGDPEFNNKVREKEYNTKKENNSFNTSKPEEKVYTLLLTKFNEDDIVRQYTDERYGTYVCDFYIKSKDLFIEYHGHWGHGGKPFDPNDEECIKRVNYWKKRAKLIPLNKHNTNFYYVNINGWCVRDVEKFDLAKKNRLNYVVFYNLKQAEDWVAQL